MHTMLKHVTVIMDVHAILMIFAPLVLFHIRYGKYDGANLQGLNMTCAFSWQKTIHEDNETDQLFVTKDSDEQYTQIQLPKGFIWKLAEAVKK